MPDPVVYTDNARVALDGRTGRVIAPADRDAITAGKDVFGAYLRFATETGDVSANEAARYKARDAPRRAMITLEGMGNIDRWNQRITQRFGLVVEPGPALRESLFCVLAQENAYPEDGKSWRSPPMEFGLMSRGRTTKRADGKIVGVKNPATGRPYLDEFLFLTARTVDDRGKSVEACKILSTTPIRRGSYYKVAIAYVDSRDEEGGRAELWINGQRQGKTFVGRTGYRGFRSPYPAVGVYCHVGQVSPIAARVYGWREGPAA